MKPFQLLCPGCAAKLKVTNRSAVGQRLACPKCREMILVAAPQGHDIGESKASVASFDDMDLDALLDNRDSAKKKKQPQVSTNKPRPKPRPKARPKSVDASPRAVQPQAQPVQPAKPELSPGEEWVNPTTKKKQRLVLFIMAAIGSLLAIAALAVFFFSGLGKGGDEVAKVPEDIKEEAGKDPVVVPEPTVEPTVEPEVIAEPEPTVVDEEPIVEPDIGEAPAIAGISDTPPAIPGTEPSIEMETEGFGNEDSAEQPVADDSANSDELDQPKNELDQLKTILAESGTSLLEIQGAATEVRNNFVIGTPKYFFEKITFEPVNPARRKDQVLLKVAYDKQPLQTVLHELSAISGLQLTINVPAIATAAMEVNPSVELEIENESTASVIRKIADSVGLAAIETDQGFQISVKSKDEFEPKEIDVSSVIANETDGIELVQLVSSLVYPGAWKASAAEPDADPAKPQGTIAFADGKLKLNHLPSVIREVEKLTDGIKAASRNDMEASPLLQPVPWIDAGGFSKKVEPMNSIRITVGQFLQSFKDDHDVQLLADWESLGRVGWTSDAMAPGRMEERTVGDVVKETAHGMGAFFYVVDEKTVWVTAPEVANNIFLLKLYPLEDLAKGRLTRPRLAHILSDSLGNEMNQPGVAVFVMATQKLAIVRAPQSLHRQIRAVFSAIK